MKVYSLNRGNEQPGELAIIVSKEEAQLLMKAVEQAAPRGSKIMRRFARKFIKDTPCF